MDKLAEFLTSDRTAPHMEPETLELLGKQAANAYLAHGTPPNDSIVKMASEYRDMTPDHIRRICEFANTALHLHQHEKNKSASSNASYPQFPLADPAAVTQDLSAKARPVIRQMVDSSYLREPSRYSVQSAEKEAALAQLFDCREPGTEKKASLDFTAESGYTDLTAAKDQLKGLQSTFQHIADEHDFILKQASEEYYGEVKRHLLEGHSFADVLIAARASGATDEKLASAMQPVVERLMREKVAGANQLQAGVRGMDKVAHRVVNPEHPFVALFATIVDAQETIDKMASDLRNIEEDLNTVNDVIKENIRAQAAR